MGFLILLILIAVGGLILKILFWGFIIKLIFGASGGNTDNHFPNNSLTYNFSSFESDYSQLLRLIEQAQQLQEQQESQSRMKAGELPQQIQFQQKMLEMNRRMRQLNELDRQRADMMKSDLMHMASSNGFDASFLNSSY